MCFAPLELEEDIVCIMRSVRHARIAPTGLLASALVLLVAAGVQKGGLESDGRPPDGAAQSGTRRAAGDSGASSRCGRLLSRSWRGAYHPPVRPSASARRPGEDAGCGEASWAARSHL